MKTALELLGTDFDSKSEVIASDGPPLGRPIGQVTYQLTVEQLERFARRVREDYELDAAATCANCGHARLFHELEHLGECLADSGPDIGCGCDDFELIVAPGAKDSAAVARRGR